MKSKVCAVTPEQRLTLLLPRLAFVDAYRVTGQGSTLTARRAALAIFSELPAWVGALMALRNRIARGFGLKTPQPALPAGDTLTDTARLGSLPVMAESPEQILFGLDDSHLDFRIVVSVQPEQTGSRQVTVTSLVRTHNLLGRAYLRVVLPFHRLIVPHLLQQAAAVRRSLAS
ncbi:MAG: DUF2867 domain-containing protein [Arenimonas sp.]